MKYLFFDVETTGLPRKYKAHYSDLPNWPRIVQLSWLISDPDGKILSEVDHIIKVDFPIPADATRIHGISNTIAETKGIPILEALNAILKAMAEIDWIICHNVAFDLAVLQSELLRSVLPAEIFTPTFCTMENSTGYCQITSNRGYKWPHLAELYRHCFDKKIKNAHNALNDVRATHEIFYHLKKENIFRI